MFWAIGVVTRIPKINRESYQNHNRTHNAIEHKKRVGPLSMPGGRLFSRETTHNNSQRNFSPHDVCADPLNSNNG